MLVKSYRVTCAKSLGFSDKWGQKNAGKVPLKHCKSTNLNGTSCILVNHRIVQTWGRPNDRILLPQYLRMVSEIFKVKFGLKLMLVRFKFASNQLLVLTGFAVRTESSGKQNWTVMNSFTIVVNLLVKSSCSLVKSIIFDRFFLFRQFQVTYKCDTNLNIIFLDLASS